MSGIISLLWYFKKLINVWLRLVFVDAHGLSLVAVSRGDSLLWCVAFSLCWLLLLWSTGYRHMGFSSCGFSCLQHAASSWTRNWTMSPSLADGFFIHCTTREVPLVFLKNYLGHFRLFWIYILESVYHIPLKGTGTLGMSIRISSDLAISLEKS